MSDDYFRHWSDPKKKWTSDMLDGVLCEYMGYVGVCGTKFGGLDGVDPMDNKMKHMRSQSSDKYENGFLRQLILDAARYPDGSAVAYKLETIFHDARAVFYKAGTNEECAFEGKSWSSEVATAIAALRLFKTLGPLKELPSWFACKKACKQYKENPFCPSDWPPEEDKQARPAD